MDWETIAKQQKELEQSFAVLKQVFEQAEMAYKQKQAKLTELIGSQIKQEAVSLSEIHAALSKILKSSELT